MVQDLDKEDDIPPSIQRVSVEEVMAVKIKENNERKLAGKKTQDKMRALGFEPDLS